ncbi:MAG: gliding motility-associated C-terminal domain-containing protein [Flavobacteriales bacterium]
MKKHIFLSLSVVALFLISFKLSAQDCSDPTQICAEDPLSGQTLDQINPVVFDCMNTLYTSYYYFSTNNSNTNTGEVDVSISNIQCMGLTGSDEIFASVVSFDPSDPCNSVLYNLESFCGSDTLELMFTAGPLMPSTSYMLLIGTDHDPLEGDCTFDVSVTGDPVDIDACCDVEIALGQSATLTAIGGDNVSGADYTWSGSLLDENTGDTVTVFPEETGAYTVTGTVDGCVVTDVITVFIGPPIGIPNAITPNDDGINDLWTISGINDFESAQVNVYDRWGQLVFKSIGYTQPWDGTNRGKFLPTGTYYYVIELNSVDVNIEPLVGFIAIVH